MGGMNGGWMRCMDGMGRLDGGLVDGVGLDSWKGYWWGLER